MVDVAGDRRVNVFGSMAAVREPLGFLSRLLSGAVVVTVFVLPLSESLKNVAYGIALASYLALIVVGGWREIVAPRVSLLFLVSLAVAIASAATSAEPREAWRGVWEIFRYTSFFFLTCRGIRGSRWTLAFLWAAVAGVGLAATVMVGRAVTAGVLLHRFTMFSLGDKSAVGQYLVMMLAVMLAMADRLQMRRAGATVLAVGGGSSLILLGLSNARAMWGALVVAVLVTVGWRRPKLVLPALGLLIIVIVGATLVQPVAAVRVAALSQVGTYRDLGERLEIWRSAVRLWRDHPWLGVGPRTFRLYAGAGGDPSRARYAVPEHRPHSQAHNLWLHTAAEMGSLGVVAMAAWVAAVCVWLARRRRRFRDGPLGAAWAGAVGALVATLVAAMTEPAIGHEHAVLLMGLLAIVMATERGEEPGAPSRPMESLSA
jgi:O-antigen ligase